MKFKKLLSLLASAAMTISALCGAMSITASAATTSGEIGDGVSFTLDTDAKTLVISGNGPMADFTKYNDAPWFGQKGNIETITVEEGVTHIGAFSIGQINNAKTLTLPSTLKSIGKNGIYATGSTGFTIDMSKCTSLETLEESAFQQSNMANISLPGSVKAIPKNAFYMCSKLESITIGNGVESIGETAFYSCSALESIEIPDSVTSIATKAFQSCGKLGTVKLSNKLESIGNSAFISCSKLAAIEIPASVKTIEPNAFSGCSGLLSLTTNEGLTEIGASAFYNCSKLATITLPNSLTTIGNNAFQSCAAIPNVEFLDTQGSITLGNNVFQACNGITNVRFPKSVKAVGNNVFQSCTGIQEVTVPSYVEFGKGVFQSCSNLTTANFTSGVTSIPESIFASCSKLKTISKPTTITEIGTSAFSGCSALTSFSLTNVTKIGNSAFSSSGLTSVDISKTVTEVGSSAFSSCSSLTSAIIRSGVQTIGSSAFSSTKIKTVTIPNTVTSLGSSAFERCSELTTVTFTATSQITRLESSLFSRCSVLADITIPKTVTYIGSSAFSSCSALTNITIPNSVTTIQSSAFSSCTGLTSITIPGSVTEIGGGSYSGAFRGCSNLETATFESGAKVVGNGMFKGDTALTEVSIPYSVESIGDYAFSGCSGLTSINLANVSSIGENAFENTKLKSILIPRGTVGNYAFSNCADLSSVDFGDDVTSIGDYAFQNCTGLKSVTLPKNLEKITFRSSFSFKGCTALAEINVPEGGTNYSSVDGVLFNADKTSLIVYPIGKTDASYTLPDSTTSIENYAFYNCTNLQGVTLPESLKTIGDFAFYGSGLTSVKIPQGVESIGADGDSTYSSGNTFKNCKSLKSASIPGSLKYIPCDAFYDCTSLQTVDIANGVEKLNYESFYGCTALESITIPNSVTKLDSYVFYNCTGLKSAKISNSLTSLPNYTFYGSGLTSITVPDSVTEFGQRVFQNCTALETVKLSKNLTILGSYTFNGCSALKHIEIPEGVYSIPYSGFSGCSSEELEIYIMGEITYKATSCFTGVVGTIYVYDQTSYDNLKSSVPATAKLVMPADFAKLREIVKKAKNLDPSAYTSNSYSKVSASLVLAEYLLSDVNSKQSSVDSAYSSLFKALSGLTRFDGLSAYEALQETIKNAEALVESDYGKDSYAALTSAIEAARAVTEDEFITEISNAQKAVEDAVDALVPVYLSPDISLDKKIYPYDDSITIDDLTDDLTTVIAEGVADEKMAGATQIRFTFDDAPNTAFNQWNYMLFRAIIGERDGETEPVVNQNNVQGTGGNAASNTGLKGLTATLTLTEPIKVGDVYRIDVSSCGWWGNEDVDYSYVITNAELLDANGKLIGKAGVEPKADLQSAIKDAEAVDTTKYTADSVAALQKALAEAKALDEQVYPVSSKMQSAIDAIKDAISKLQSTAPAEADYTAVDAALAKIPSDLSGYTDESVKALNDAKNAVVRGLSADEQARVDGFATAIEEAIQKLEKKQDSSQQGPGNNDNKKPGGQTNTTTPPANDKVNAAKDKAQRVMDQAKLKKLSVKSKAKKKITVKWKKVAGAKGYQVEVSKDRNFKQSKRVLLKNVKGKKLVIKKKLKSKKIYFVRVRAYATYKNDKGVTKKVYSKWNKKLRKVKVK